MPFARPCLLLRQNRNTAASLCKSSARGLIRENWVLVDILDVCRRIGVDVFDRMRAYTHHRQ